MEKKSLKKLVLNRETLRDLSVEETRKVVGGEDNPFSGEDSCNNCARVRITVG
jgi:hypothetical protein